MIATLAFAGIVVSMMQTLIVPLIPRLPRLLHASGPDATWVVTATLLSASVAAPVAGGLGDLYGKRRLLLLSLVLLVAGSFVVALSNTLAPAIIGRILQGLAAGTVPLGMGIMRDELPPERLVGATAIMSASLGIGSALGLPIAAFVADNVDWHVLFIGSGILGIAALLLVRVMVPPSTRAAGGHFDVPGALGLAAGLVCLLLAISKGASWGWSSAAILGLFAAAATILTIWARLEMRAGAPLVDLRSSMRPQVLFTNLASLAVGFAMFVVSMVVPQLVQLPAANGYGLGGTLLTAGLVMAPQGLVMLVTSPLSAHLTRARGPRLTLMLGTGIVACGYTLNIVLMHEIWHQVLVSCIIGLGIGFAYGAMPALIMGAVPASQSAAANSLNTLMRTLGSSLSSVAMGVLFAHFVTPSVTGSIPSQNAFRIAMATGAAAALTALFIAVFLPGRNRDHTTGAAAPDRTTPKKESSP